MGFNLLVMQKDFVIKTIITRKMIRTEMTLKLTFALVIMTAGRLLKIVGGRWGLKWGNGDKSQVHTKGTTTAFRDRHPLQAIKWHLTRPHRNPMNQIRKIR